ncbi:MAG: hypothetical protein ACK5X3_11640 [Pseudomonadota bacterium]|jgi:hypothetical protein
MTEADEAIERLTAQLNHLVSLESVGVMVKTTDLAAVLARAARVAELEAALEFYANSANWQSPSSGFEAQYDPKPSAVSADRGARARAVLATPEGEG